MVQPITTKEEQALVYQLPFMIDEILLVLFDIEHYNAVEHEENGQIKQRMSDIPQAPKDCEDIKNTLFRFGLKPENVITFPDKTYKGMKKIYDEKIRDKLKAGKHSKPPINYFVVHVYSGNGIHHQGTQWICLNEFDPETNYYKMWPAEKTMRTYSQMYPNSFTFGVFVCCREIYEFSCSPPSECFPKGQHEKAATVTKPEDEPYQIQEKAYGKSDTTLVKHENVFFLFGCKPGDGINLNTKMISDLTQCLFSQVNQSDSSITFPTVLEQMISSDCDFETIASNSIQKAKLYFNHNVATHTLSLTIYNTVLEKTGDALTAISPEEVLAAVETVKTVLGILDAKIVEDGTKTEIIAAMDELQAEVDDFQNNQKHGQTLFINFNWIGFVCDYELDDAPGKCKDGTTCPQEYGVVKDGGLIPIYEFASRLCAAKNIHVLFVQEKCFQYPDKRIINKDNTWQMKLDAHWGWPRLTYFKVPQEKFSEFFEYFENEKSSNDTHIFRFSSLLEHAKERSVDWEEHGPKITPEEVVVDGRSLSVKSRQSKNVSTFIPPMWLEKPISVFVNETKQPDAQSAWYQSCTSLPEQGQILHVVLSPDGKNVELYFHKIYDKGNDAVLDIEQTVTVKKRDFKYSIVAKNFSGYPMENEVIVLFGIYDYTPSMTLVFKRLNESSPWNPPQEYPNTTTEFEQLRNAFLIRNQKNETCLMIFRSYTLAVLNKEMVQVATVDYEQDWCQEIYRGCNSAQPDYHSKSNNGLTWIMTFHTDPMPMCGNKYKGDNDDQNSCCMRVQVGSDGTIKPVDIKSESLRFEDEIIYDICEYAENKMIVSNSYKSHLFLVHDWKVVHKVTDPDQYNISKRSFTLFPGFSLDQLPFIISCGNSSFSIINVVQAHEDVVIKAKTSTHWNGQQKACFFTADGDDATTLHFTTTSQTEEKTWNQVWHTLSLQKDFSNILKEHGRLPIMTFEEGFNLIKKEAEHVKKEAKLVKEKAELAEKIAALTEEIKKMKSSNK